MEKLISRIEDLEMEGVINRHQRNILLKQLKGYMHDAAGERDAHLLRRLQDLEKRLKEIRIKDSKTFLSYLQEVFIEGQIIFTFFDILGIILFFSTDIAERLLIDVYLARIIGGLIFFISFIWANFRVYKKQP